MQGVLDVKEGLLALVYDGRGDRGRGEVVVVAMEVRLRLEKSGEHTARQNMR